VTPLPKVTEAEFLANYFARTGKRARAIPCRCGHRGCQGWEAIWLEHEGSTEPQPTGTE
jgi:hypothetical protein